MRLGVNVPNFGPGSDPGDLLAWARFAEESGFATAVVSDHVAPTPDVAAVYPPPFADPFPALAWLAAQTTTLRLGTSVLVLPLRHPLHTARLAANLDRLSGGRFVLGVGVGWSRPEYEALGIPFGRRGSLTDEYLEAILEAWHHPTVTRRSPTLDYHDVHTGPAPVQDPHPPVWVGGMGVAAMRRAARWGTAWHPVSPGRDWLLHRALPMLHRVAEESGRPAPVVVPRIKAWVEPQDVGEAGRPLGRGSLRQIGRDLTALAEAGMPEVVLDPNPDHPHDRRPRQQEWDQLARIASVAPG